MLYFNYVAAHSVSRKMSTSEMSRGLPGSAASQEIDFSANLMKTAFRIGLLNLTGLSEQMLYFRHALHTILDL
jgi:hypothetical protein